MEVTIKNGQIVSLYDDEIETGSYEQIEVDE